LRRSRAGFATPTPHLRAIRATQEKGFCRSFMVEQKQIKSYIARLLKQNSSAGGGINRGDTASSRS
jgi:hypothetical protein